MGDQDYQMQRAWGERASASVEPRFQSIAERERRSDLSSETVRRIAQGKYLTRWKGLEVMKDPFDLTLYQRLFWDVRPGTVIEIGAYSGGTAVWMADILAAMGIKTDLWSMDIDLSLLAPEARDHKSIRFIEGNSNDIAAALPPTTLRELKHPVIVIEDAHVNVLEVLNHFHDHCLLPGDYIIADDTNPDGPATTHMAVDPEVPYRPVGPEKLEIIEQFIARNPEAYKVDRGLCDMFGYNMTWNWNGYLKRV